MKDVYVNVRISKELKERFERALSEQGLSQSDFIVSRILQFVEENERRDLK